ncbi:Dolichyl-phosphate beta-D-mannosyltransferase [Geobacter metallireducens RCH3]|uniref:GDP-mannose--undecaprenyl-phosphate mannosyltransferase n=1 Tax=Geobacter metallireducens (strain ATCC 53774 / DSM 7210 / GS-15) TaxID=269799 RepID=Q39UH5_GEOMG|nr:polyprenol monophosphomannose synthase [Geobacter metallireducens]ABB32099.1 GDP-mannose--undecaprenyl-phosphate mannosyltransferase [Geobacter metallireducens GS-15]EHP88713.1 Dolichyl-phosphate beta-D-mannosyltransferase [Geobacter metallireducens RCH3]
MKVYVVVPTYNESDNIVALMEKILAQRDNIHVLVVDDNSPDGTGEIAARMSSDNPRIHVLRRSGKMGLGSAYCDGFRVALRDGADFIIEMDADFSHDPATIPALLAATDKYDVVVGSRYLNGVSVVNWPIRRLMLSYFASVYTRFVTGLALRDCTSGFKCFRRRVIESVDLDTIRSDGYSFQIEMNYRCVERGFRVGEIPIIFIDRHAGSSKMSKKIVREAVLMVWKLKLGSLVKKLTRRGDRHAA